MKRNNIDNVTLLYFSCSTASSSMAKQFFHSMSTIFFIITLKSCHKSSTSLSSITSSRTRWIHSIFTQNSVKLPNKANRFNSVTASIAAAAADGDEAPFTTCVIYIGFVYFLTLHSFQFLHSFNYLHRTHIDTRTLSLSLSLTHTLIRLVFFSKIYYSYVCT